MKPRRCHKLYIVLTALRWFWVLVLPVVQGLWRVLQTRRWSEFFSLWQYALALGLLVAYGCVRWWLRTFTVGPDALHVTDGLLVRRGYTIPFDAIVCVSAERPLLWRLVRACRLKGETDTTGEKQSAVELVVSRRTGEEIMRLVSGERHDDEDAFVYHPRSMYIAVQSLLESNVFVGVALLAAFFHYAGKLSTNFATAYLIETAEQIIHIFETILPRTLSIAAVVLLAGFGVSFAVNFIRLSRFYVTKGQTSHYIARGLLYRERVYFDSHAIIFSDVRESLLTRLLGLRSVYVGLPGLSRGREAGTALIPAAGDRRLRRILPRLLPGYPTDTKVVRSRAGSILRFVWFPIFILLAIIVLWVVGGTLLPVWGPFFRLAGLCAVVPFGWLLALRLFAWRDTGLARRDGKLVLRFHKGYTLHTVVVDDRQLFGVTIKQSPAGRYFGSCDVLVHTQLRTHRAVKVRSVPIEDVREMFGYET